jgi:flagellar hook-length control protein FliK
LSGRGANREKGDAADNSLTGDSAQPADETDGASGPQGKITIEKKRLKTESQPAKGAKPTKAARGSEMKSEMGAGDATAVDEAVDRNVSAESGETVAESEAGLSEERDTATEETTNSRASKEEKLEPAKLDPVRQAGAALPAVDEASKAESPSSGEPGGNDAGISTKVDAPSAAHVARSVPTLDRLAARSMRSEAANSPESGPAIDRPRFVQRVEGALRAAQQRDGRVQVRLSPPELGNLRIELAVQNGVLTAKLEAETPAARNALLDNLPALRDRLAQQDIRVEKFDVDVRRDFNNSGSGGSGGPQDRPTGQSDSRRHDGRDRPTPMPRTVAQAARPAAANAVSDAGLDVRI